MALEGAGCSGILFFQEELPGPAQVSLARWSSTRLTCGQQNTARPLPAPTPAKTPSPWFLEPACVWPDVAEGTWQAWLSEGPCHEGWSWGDPSGPRGITSPWNQSPFPSCGQRKRRQWRWVRDAGSLALVMETVPWAKKEGRLLDAGRGENSLSLEPQGPHLGLTQWDRVKSFWPQTADTEHVLLKW